VVIENQITQTDRNHLGKFLTCSSALDAGVSVWVVEALRGENPQDLDWLNQHSDSETVFFGIVVGGWQQTARDRL